MAYNAVNLQIMLYRLPNEFEERIDSLLAEQSLSLSKTTKLSEAILELSDFYIHESGKPTPWHKSSTVAAHLAYYFPLNYIRSSALLGEATRLGFLNKGDEIIDFGAGLSPLVACLDESLNLKSHCVEASEVCADLFPKLVPNSKSKWYRDIKEIEKAKNQILCMSYSLNELSEVPEWMFSYDRLLIMEPSDRATGRKVLELRKKLIEQGYFIWAPCTHQLECPLLKESKTDWCHTREFWEQPQWFQKIENHLPIKNRTLTYSYLLASRSPAPEVLSKQARLTGDLLKEKGKSRQLICRSDRREYLAWLKRDGDAPEWKRGSRVKVNGAPKVAGNELRVSKDDVILVEV